MRTCIYSAGSCSSNRIPCFFLDFSHHLPSTRSAATSSSPAYLPSARPEHYSSSSTTTTTHATTHPTTHATAPLQAPAGHFGHQTPWVAAPLTGSFPGGPAYPNHDYFAIERPAGSPHSTGPSNLSDISGSPTLGERTPPPLTQAALPAKLLSSLSPENQRIVKDADPAHQQAIMDILVAPDFSGRGDIPAEKLQAFYTSVPHARNEGDKQGSRGGAAGYTCRWHACPQGEKLIKRRDHMINHIRGHFGVKPFGCTFGNGVNLPRWCVTPPSYDRNTFLNLTTARLVSCEQTTSSAMCGRFTPRTLTPTCMSPYSHPHRYIHDADPLTSNIVDPDPKKQSKSKRGVTDSAETRRARGYQPYPTSNPDHRRTVSDVANYEFTQPPQAQPQAFFAHGPGQRYGAYGKVVHCLRVLHSIAWFSTSACGLCRCRCLSRTLKRWKTRRWEDSPSRLLNAFVIIARFRHMNTNRLDTSAAKAKYEINCIAHHVSHYWKV